MTLHAYAAMTLAAAIALSGASSAAENAKDKTNSTLGYPVSGEAHERSSIPVRAIVSSSDTLRKPSHGPTEEHDLVHQVCNVDGADKKTRRLYFQWSAAGFRTAVLEELRFEHCLRFERFLTARTRPSSEDVLYTYQPKPLPARTRVMDTQPPWSKPDQYWSYVSTLLSGKLMLDMKEAQKEFTISAVRKSPKEKICIQSMRWKKGRLLYMTLPKMPPEAANALRSQLANRERDGYVFSIRPGAEATRDFADAGDAWVAASFGSREVLMIERLPEKETDESSVQLDLPVSDPDIVELPVVVRDRASKRAAFGAVYVTAGT